MKIPRNATEARDLLLRNKRGIEQLSKNVDRNTKAVYVSDDMVTLRFHKTDIAAYLPDGVRLDTRANADDPNTPTGNGHWFTNTTWQRLHSHTPIANFKSNGLTYIYPRGGSHDSARLYVPGALLYEDGTWDEDSLLMPELESHVQTIVNRYPRRLARYADKVVDKWLSWRYTANCCRVSGWTDDAQLHALDHFEANQVCVPPYLASLADRLARNRETRRANVVPQIKKEARSMFRTLMPYALQRAVPEFPFPQATPRRTT